MRFKAESLSIPTQNCGTVQLPQLTQHEKRFVYQGVTFHTFQNQAFFHICMPNSAEK